MDYASFSNSPAGRLVSTTHGQKAFVPNPLPPRLDGSRLWCELAEAMGAVGKLGGLSHRIPNPMMVLRPLQRREALTSSSMEGTHASPDDLVLLEAGANEGDDSTREVRNYIRALDNATESLKTLPISRRMICAAHETLLTGLSKFRGANKRPGELKKYQNFIGGRTIEETRFIPPPPTEAEAALNDLEFYINADAPEYPALIDAALIHYQFETIHPFADGNGRVGRILIPIYLLKRGVIDTPILYISPYIENRKDSYIDLMFNVSATGAWEEWISFFLRAVRESCDETIESIEELLALRQKYFERASRLGRSATPQRIVDSLFVRPVLSIPQAAETAGVTYAAAAAAVEKLVAAGILREWPLESAPRFFYAPEVVLISAGSFRRKAENSSEPT